MFTNGQYRFLVIIQSFIQTFLYTTPNHQPSQYFVSLISESSCKSHLFSRFLIPFWVKLIKLSLWLNSGFETFFLFYKSCLEIILPGNNKTGELPKVAIVVSFEWHHSCLFHVCPLRKVRKKPVLIEFIQDVIKKFAREGGS